MRNLDEKNIHELDALIGGSHVVTVAVHTHPDGDALGSGMALVSYLRKRRGVDAALAVPDPVPYNLQFVVEGQECLVWTEDPDAVSRRIGRSDLLFCLDFNTASRVDQMETSLRQSPARKVLIDHHLDPDVETVLTVSHPDASSTCELVFRLVWQMGCFELLGKHFATPIYCGMMTDTGGFTYNSNSPDIYFIISQLLTKRINKDRIYRNVFHNFSDMLDLQIATVHVDNHVKLGILSVLFF